MPPVKAKIQLRFLPAPATFRLKDRSWTTAILSGLAAVGMIIHGVLLIVESQRVRKGFGRTYSRRGQLRIQVVYEHLPHTPFDVVCPDTTLKAGTEVTVYAFGTELWHVRSVGDSPNFPSGSSASIATPIFLMVFAVLLLLWYWLGRGEAEPVVAKEGK